MDYKQITAESQRTQRATQRPQRLRGEKKINTETQRTQRNKTSVSTVPPW